MNKKEKSEAMEIIDKYNEEKSMISKIVPRGTDTARVIKVIETKSLKGKGTHEDTCRFILQYWDFDGNLLAENDPLKR